MKVMRYKPSERGARVGSFDLSINLGKHGPFIIHDCTHFRKNSHEWIALPQRTYEQNGETKYFPICQFENPETRKSFSNQVIDAIRKYFDNRDDLCE